MSVFVLDRRKKPLMPCSEKRARLLLERKRAVVARFVPFTIRLKDRVSGALQPVSIKLDPGSKVTGLAVTRESCDKTQVPLQIEHIVPKASGGSDRVSNLTLAYHACNRKKGKQAVEVFLAKKPAVLKKVLARAKVPLRDAAAVNTTRWALFGALRATALPVEAASGGQTKWNRARFGIPKTHALDALCVGRIEAVVDWHKPVLAIKTTGRGSYQRTRVTAAGFKLGYLMRAKSAFGFRTGDLVRAVVPEGKKAGTHTGRVAIRASGSFNVQTHGGVLQGLSYRYCRTLQRGDGYGYARQTVLLPRLPSRGDGFRTGEVG